MAQGNQRDFFDWTDLCRAVAAMLVVVSHARDILMIDYPGQKQWLPFYAVTGFGHSGVIVFFVLSGFWISRSVQARINNQSFWRGYLIDRLSRLGIVLVPALILGGLLDVFGEAWLHLPDYSGLTGSHSLTENVAVSLTGRVLLGNLAFLQTIFVPPWGSNGPLWSLAYEFWYYLWFPALALLVRRRRFSVALLTLLIGIANPGLYWCFVSWLVGWVLLLRTEAAPNDVADRRWALFAALLFAAVMLASGVIKQRWTDLALSISFALFLLALVRSAIPFPRLFLPIARYGRKASFSLYAIHFPIIALVGGWVTGSARLPPSTLALVLVLALTGLCLLTGWCFAQGTEAFTQRLRNWLRHRLLKHA